MADFIAYQERVDRPKRDDGKVALSPDRWQSLVAWFMAPPYIHSTPIEIEVIEPVNVSGVLFLPAVYLAA